MKRVLSILLVIIIALGIFVYFTLNSTGFFRKIENQGTETIIKSIPLIGTEDIVASQDGAFVVISATKRGTIFKNAVQKDGIYFMDLKNESYETKLISGDFDQDFHPHGIDMIRLDSARHRIFAINHVENVHTVEVFTLYHRDSLVFEKTLKDDAMFSPNDVVAIGEDEFYFTNDKNDTSKWGKLQADYLGKAACKITYFDGENYRTVAQGFAYANGINYDKKRKLMYIASSRGFLIKVFQREDNGDLTHLKNIPCKTGVDNIEFDTNGDLWIGCHPSLLAFQGYSDGKKEKAPSEIITINYQDNGDYTIKNVFMDDGTNVSGSSTAAVFKNRIFVGNVMDDHFLVLEKL